MTAPVLDTARLRMRAHRIDDLADCAAMWGDPNVTRHLGGIPAKPEECWSRILRYAGHWTLLGFGYWAVEERDTGRYVGEVGFADFKRDITPAFAGEPEIGWVLASWAHGFGFATEAARAAVAWADGHFSAARTVCLINPENDASVHVANKCGYKEYARGVYKDHAAILLERSR